MRPKNKAWGLYMMVAGIDWVSFNIKETANPFEKAGLEFERLGDVLATIKDKRFRKKMPFILIGVLMLLNMCVIWATWTYFL